MSLPNLGQGPVRLDGVDVSLGHQHVLRDIHHVFEPGVSVLVGRNGAGKTTLVRALVTAIGVDAGRVLRDGRDVHATHGALREHRRHLGWLPQQPGLPTGMRVEELCDYAAWLKQVPRQVRPAAVDDALDLASIGDLRRRQLGKLSGGQRRRAALAAAIVGRPSLLVLDEPTTGLDPAQRVRFHESVRSIPDSTIVVSTHLMDDLELVGDRWVLLEAGRVLDRGVVDRSDPAATSTTVRNVRARLLRDDEAPER